MNLVSEKLDIAIFKYQSLFAQTYRCIKTQDRVLKVAFCAYRNGLRRKLVAPVPRLYHATPVWSRNVAVG